MCTVYIRWNKVRALNPANTLEASLGLQEIGSGLSGARATVVGILSNKVEDLRCCRIQ